MAALFEHIYSNGALLIMWGALLFHLLLPIPQAAHPAMLWRAFARILADKVNTPASYTQSLLSGTLAWLLMTIPALILFLALKPLVWKSELFELALLLLAIDWRNTEKFTAHFTRALSEEDKHKARKLLQPVLNRQTETLSIVGLGKAGAETIILGYGRNVVCVLFWYGLSGGTGALMYRLTQELARAWSPSRADFLPFGIPAVRLLAVLEYIPLRLFSLLLLAGKQAGKCSTRMLAQSKSWPTPGPGWLLATAAGKLDLSVGGPAIYPDKHHSSSQKSIRAKLGGRIVPSAFHLAQLQKLLVWRIFIWVSLQSLIMLLSYQGV
ncbi:adenosylcobinamide-phosphate synthase [Vibrio sp. HA2012]|uniref:cobalamin biosynthesis family protein n=1 Tax=Vibrio sp. HA2012 TaxID=1971595 RepID=UPI000C2B9E99|nr:cobalamin biosynthesis family protein [Vibrio sp. HA2012]PJC86220.1 adenosylcobinamide-phosphate synthase [Vibrio sp. HA2012]